MLTYPTKRVDEVLDYSIDWSARLGTDTIASARVGVPAGLTVDSEGYTGAVQTIWLSGGTPGVGKVIYEVTTASGRIMEEAVQLTVAA